MAKPKKINTRPRRGSSISPTSVKLQRWIDVLAALLARRYPTTFEELRHDVPAYAAARGATLMRMFERDKDELRAFGVPIETVTTDDGTETCYRLRSENFYLPFLAVATNPRSSTRTRVPAEGYRGLPQLAFEPDELREVADAAARVRQLGEPLLSADVDQAMRKLAFDLPPDSLPEPGDERILAELVDEKTFSTVARALLDRKVVAFDCYAMSADETSRREAEPYGLAFLGAHWYLVAHDRGRNALRTFRVSRMENLTPSRARAQSPDYEIPSSFSLADYARSRDSWALGDDRVIEGVVEFTDSSGVARTAAKLGESARGVPGCRRFQVRRPDAFARWLLGFAGEAMPIDPPELVERYKAIARQTLDVYGRGK